MCALHWNEEELNDKNLGLQSILTKEQCIVREATKQRIKTELLGAEDYGKAKIWGNLRYKKGSLTRFVL